MKICRCLRSKGDFDGFPLIWTELLRKRYGSKHRSVHSGMSDEMKLRDLFPSRLDLSENTQQVPLALDSADNDVARKTILAFLASECPGYHRKLLTALSVERSVNNDDDLFSHRAASRERHPRPWSLISSQDSQCPLVPWNPAPA